MDGLVGWGGGLGWLGLLGWLGHCDLAISYSLSKLVR